jgi:Protein of unknown function (DUF4236)
MPFYFRDSINFGPFRFNLSNSGIGISAGVKGFRVGTGPRGHYINAGINGIYYRRTFGGIGDKNRTARSKNTQTGEKSKSVNALGQSNAATYLTEDGVLMRRIISKEVEMMIDESRAEAVESLNDAQGRASLTLLTFIVGAIVAAALAVGSANGTIVAVAVSLFALTLVFAQRADMARRQVVFLYQMDDKAEAYYKALVEAVDRLAGSGGLWYVDAEGDVNNLTAWKRNSGASHLVSKHATKITYEVPPGVQSNVTPPCLAVEGKRLYFLPDCIMVREGRRYGTVSYADIRCGVRDSRFIVVDEVPQDAMVVGQTWKHPNKNGGPDRRFNNNRQVPICLFEELAMISSSGLKVLVQMSLRNTASRVEQAIQSVAATSHEAKSSENVLLSYVK